MPGKDGTGPLGRGPMRGKGAGAGAQGRAGLGKGRGGRGLGPQGQCACPQCGTTAPHTPGIPCVEQVCPNCGAKMVRA